MATVDEVACEARPHEVVPLFSGRGDSGPKQCGNRRLETSVVAPIRAAVETTGDEIAFRGCQTLFCLGPERPLGPFHDPIIPGRSGTALRWVRFAHTARPVPCRTHGRPV